MKELIAYIDSKEQKMLEVLEALVNIDSGCDDKAGVDTVGASLAERFAALGFTVTVERIPQKEHGDHLIGHKPGTGERGLF